MKRFNVKKVNEVQGKEQCCVKSSSRFAASSSLVKDENGDSFADFHNILNS
jgi:hypothetical protein